MKKHTIHHYMRSLHRDIGYFLIGLTVIYSLSGIILIYRETDLLKSEKTIEKQLEPNMGEQELGNILHIRGFKVIKTESDIMYFSNGTYNKATGIASYTENALPTVIENFNSLHKKSSKNISHIFSTIYGILLFFLAISSFWMFKSRSKMFRRGVILAASGLIFAIVLLFL